MNKFAAISFACLVALVAIVALVQANGYGSAGYGYSAPSYGQNYERKTGYKTVSSCGEPCEALAPAPTVHLASRGKSH